MCVCDNALFIGIVCKSDRVAKLDGCVCVCIINVMSSVVRCICLSLCLCILYFVLCTIVYVL